MGETQFEISEQPLNEKFIKVREQKNLTLEAVSKSLSLSVLQLNKLESESIDLNSMSTFERGYVRNYAQLLGIDIQPYEVDFAEAPQASSELKSLSRFKYPVPQPFFKKGAGKTTLVVFVVFVVVGLITVIFIR